MPVCFCVGTQWAGAPLPPLPASSATGDPAQTVPFGAGASTRLFSHCVHPQGESQLFLVVGTGSAGPPNTKCIFSSWAEDPVKGPGHRPPSSLGATLPIELVLFSVLSLASGLSLEI